MTDIQGRVAGLTAIVTGGASGIGAACAKVLAAHGANVVVSDVDANGGQNTANAIVSDGGTATFLQHDVTSEGQWKGIIAATVSQYGGLNILVNNAGLGIGGLCEEMTLEDWRRQTAVNIDGVFLGTKYAIPAMRASGKGSIIIMSSGAGLKGTAGMSGYCATKGAVRLFAKAVALELSGLGDNIRVNSVHPGLIETPIWQKVDDNTKGVMSGALTDDGTAVDPVKLASAGVPNGVLGQPEDIALGVLYLASDDARYVTGSELTIDGGATAG